MGRNILIILFLLILSSGCGPEISLLGSPDELSEANCISQNLRILSFDSLPSSRGSSIYADTFFQPLDEDSIELFVYGGGQYYHPVFLGHRSEIMLFAYYLTKDQKYVRRAEKNILKLMSLAQVYGESSFLPYMFKYCVHSDSGLTFNPPWYSGMGQGVNLAIAIRLFEITGKSQYLDFSHKLFHSLLQLRKSNSPWVARLDSLRYYWIEEYPHDVKPGQTLNGYIAAIMGVYEYYRVTGDYRAKRVYDASLTTLKYYLLQYRRENQTSYYCLGHKMPATSAYHSLHIQMMQDLYCVSGDFFFMAMAELFRADVKFPGPADNIDTAGNDPSSLFPQF